LRLVFDFDLDFDLILISAPFKVRCLDLYIWFCI